MPDNSTRVLAVTLPDAIRPEGMPAVLALAIVDDAKISGGTRAIQRSLVDANASTPGRIRRVEWNFWGPIGGSLQSSTAQSGAAAQGGGLIVDFVQSMECRWPRRLLAAGRQVFVDLTVLDPPATENAIFDEFDFDDVHAPFDSPIAGADVVCMDEQQGFLFVHRGRLSTQVDLQTWTVVQTVIQPAVVRDADNWRGLGRIALGSNAPMQTRTGVTATGATYADTVSLAPAGNVYAFAVKTGGDRAWYIDADIGGSTFNYAGYTLDSFATLAQPFQVGDPDMGANGIGPFGPFTFFGFQNNFFSFTDQGKPVRMSRALVNHLSAQNGKQWADPGFGWNYALSAIGLRAVQPGQDNPVGIGERMREFTGHNGVPVAIWQERGELWVVYQTTAGDLYGYRGIFSKVSRTADEQALNFGNSPFYSQTQTTGQFDLYPWFYQAAGTCTAVFSSATPPQPVVIRADGTSIRYEVIAANGRDDLDPAYVYATTGGTAYLTTLDVNFNLLKTLRLARLRTRSLAAGDSFQLGFAFDASPTAPTAASYTSVGTVTTNGYHTLVPTGGAVDGQGNPTPTADISGHTIKPRVVAVAGGIGASATPPELNGTLEVEYDERPDQIETIEAVVNISVAATGYSNNLVWDLLQKLVGSQSDGPFKIQLPDDAAPALSAASGGGQKYAMIESVTARKDVADNDIQAVTVKLNVWPQAAALAA